MSDEIRVTQEELDSIKKLQEDYNKKIIEFGQISIQVIDLEDIQAKLKSDLKNLREQEKSFAKQLSDKYGVGKLDINTGIFTKNQQ